VAELGLIHGRRCDAPAPGSAFKTIKKRRSSRRSSEAQRKGQERDGGNKPEVEASPEASPRPSVSAPVEAPPVEDDEWTTVTKKGKGKKEPPKAPWAKPVQVREEPPWRKKRS